MDVYDIVSDSWSLKSAPILPQNDFSASKELIGHCTVGYQNKLYVTGGSVNTSAVNPGYMVFDTVMEAWTSKRHIEMTVPLRDLSCTLAYVNQEGPLLVAIGLSELEFDNDNNIHNQPLTMVQALNLSNQDLGWTSFPSIPKWWQGTRHLVNFGKSMLVWGGLTLTSGYYKNDQPEQACRLSSGKHNIAAFNWIEGQWCTDPELGMFKPGYYEMFDYVAFAAYAVMPSRFFNEYVCDWKSSSSNETLVFFDDQSGEPNGDDLLNLERKQNLPKILLETFVPSNDTDIFHKCLAFYT